MKSEEQRTPPAFMTKGMNADERKKFFESWVNAKWLTDPLRDNLVNRRTKLTNTLVYSEGAAEIPDVDLKAEIRVIDRFLYMLP